MSTKPIKRTDWVRCKTDPRWIGIVLRVARDGSWADVNWHTHSKRMQVSALEVLHTIPLGDGVTLTDCTRQEEFVINEAPAGHEGPPAAEGVSHALVS